MREPAKRAHRILSACAVGVLLGLGLALFVLILPALAPKLGPSAVLAAAGSLLALEPLLAALSRVGEAEAVAT
jgi:ABC-type nitrate/sulfonate/bicarbonate transport system permease component